MPSKHAKLSPSAAARWINCPGSVALSELCPAPGTSDFAEEGTTAHALAEIKLQRDHEISPNEYKRRRAKLEKSEWYCAEMDEATDYYTNAVWEAYDSLGEDAELLVEQQLDLTRWVPDSFGTSDAVVIGNHVLQVVDLKYGKGIKVEAPGNPQLRLYGLGAVDLFGDLYDLDTVRMTIIQPRLDHISTEELPLKELLLWAEEEVKPRAIMAAEGSDYFAAGDWCRWCPAKAQCSKRAEKNLEMAKYDFAPAGLLSNDEIADVLQRADELQKWSADVSAFALAQALTGEHFDGWKLVEGRSVRKYADEPAVAQTLQANGFDEAMLYERKMLGLTAMEKLVGKKKLTQLLGPLIIKPAGKPVLVPESDKRDAICTADSAKADFAE